MTPFALAAALGAGVAYFYDPASGPGRRAAAGERARAFLERGSRFMPRATGFKDGHRQHGTHPGEEPELADSVNSA